MTGVLATVVAAGICTVQDGGRRGYTRVGVPVSGALHRMRYLMATALVNGRPDEAIPAIELLAGDLSLHAESALVVTVVGPSTLSIDGETGAVGAVVLVPAGADVLISHGGRGPVYIAIEGWTPPRTLGSVSTDTFSGLGGSPLAAGDVLAGSTTPRGPDRVGAFHVPVVETLGAIRVVSSGNPNLSRFVGQRWTTQVSARSGVRLLGEHPTSVPESIASMPVLPGAVQMTPSGEAIILGPDGGLTGGYPVVGVIATSDLDRVSLLRPGDTVSFTEIGIEGAARACAAAMRELRRSVAHPAQLP